MFPSIPDKVSKVLFALGIASFIFFYSEKSKNNNEISIKKDKLIDLKLENKDNNKDLENFIELKITKINEDILSLSLANNTNYLILLVSLVFAFFGLLGWITEEKQQDRKSSVKRIEDKIHKYCESCGMLFNSVRKYGTNSDKSLSNSFCEDCFENGAFLDKKLTFEKVLENAKPHLSKASRIDRRYLIIRLKNLDRWNRDKYFDN